MRSHRNEHRQKKRSENRLLGTLNVRVRMVAVGIGEKPGVETERVEQKGKQNKRSKEEGEIRYCAKSKKIRTKIPTTCFSPKDNVLLLI